MQESADEASTRQTEMIALEKSRNGQLMASRDEYRKLAEQDEGVAGPEEYRKLVQQDATLDAEHRVAEAMYDAQQEKFKAAQMDFEAKQKIRNAARKEFEAEMTIATMRLEHAEAKASQEDRHEQEMKAMKDTMKAEIEALRSQLRIMNKRQH